jgi:ASPIC and UnbV/FG-GAP-like repeat
LARIAIALVLVGGVAAAVAFKYPRDSVSTHRVNRPTLTYRPKKPVDTAGFSAVLPILEPWPTTASLTEVSRHFERAGYRNIDKIDQAFAQDQVPDEQRIVFTVMKAALFNYEGEPGRAYDVLERARSWLEDGRDALAEQWLYSVIFFQGTTALRQGENDNCIMCRGESSCILPLAASAVHTRPDGSRLAINHFTEYLQKFPDDLEIRWLLNLAHMTLGEHPAKVDPRYLISLDRFSHSEFDIGKFRDIGHLVGVNRFNQSGGAIMDDFDGDGLLDLAVTCNDLAQSMSIYHNNGDGRFEDRSQSARVIDQVGGLVCYQTDYNNDGRLDIFIARGAWVPYAVRPSLLRNDGDGGFTDVTAEAGLLTPVNSNAAAWADFDNDGWLDLFIACERQPHRLYHNRRDGTFEDVAAKAGVAEDREKFSKGCTWIDYDNDGFPDLFLNDLHKARLYHNNQNGMFTSATAEMGIDGPAVGFPCWAWDYDNDGWLDIFATSYDLTLADIVKGILGKEHRRHSNRLYRNKGGKGFEDTTQEAGLDMVFATMGCNYGDFDNDGWLDMYLGTGDPNLATLVPNRMFKNVGGRRFAEITGSSGTGHLQKGHGVACGDWDCDGDIDIFIEMGGATNGDKYHNILFQNPGQGNNWLTVKLVGVKTNRPAIGARIKAVMAGDKSLSVYRHVSSGSSFGANTLRQTIGMGKASRIAELRIDWPTSKTTQVFRDLPANQTIEVTEFASAYKTITHKPIPLPE